MTYEEIEELAGHRQVPAWVVKLVSDAVAAQKKEWVGLTKEELAEISEFHFHGAFSGREFYEDIETRLKEKNT